MLTVADLEQPAISLLVLGMITSTEAALDELIERASSRRWLDLLNEKGRRQVQDIYENRRRHDADFSLVRCLDLPKRVDLSMKLELTEQLGIESRTAFTQWKKTVVDVRNHLAHGSTILSALPDPAQALDTIAEVRSSAARSWLLVEDEGSKLQALTRATISMVAAPFSELLGPNAVISLPVTAPPFVSTAENPGGLTSNADTNSRHVDELQSALEEEGVPFIPVQAGEGDWQETSLLVSAADLPPTESSIWPNGLVSTASSDSTKTTSTSSASRTSRSSTHRPVVCRSSVIGDVSSSLRRSTAAHPQQMDPESAPNWPPRVRTSRWPARIDRTPVATRRDLDAGSAG